MPHEAGVAGLMAGMTVGEHRTQPLSMPASPDLQPATLRGQDTLVSIKLKELFEPDLPAVGGRSVVG